MSDFTPHYFAGLLFARLASMDAFVDVTLNKRYDKFRFDCLFKDETRPRITIQFDAGNHTFVTCGADIRRIDLDRHNFGGNICEDNIEHIYNGVRFFLDKI